jgi:hypothetical protein
MGRARYFVIAAALVLSACGDEPKPDIGKITDDLARDVQEQTGTQDVRVACPDDVSEGDLCDVTAAGGLKAKIRITEIDDGAKGQIVQP